MRKSDASSMSAAMDQIANNTPLNTSAVVKIGNVSIMEDAKSGKFATIAEKSENISDAIEKNPDCERLATKLRYPATIIPTDALNTHAEAAIFMPNSRRSRRPMVASIFSVNPAGGSGVRSVEKSF